MKVAHFFRSTGFDYRGKVDDPRERRFLDRGLIAGRVPGVLLACSFGIINAMWVETQDDEEADTSGTR